MTPSECQNTSQDMLEVYAVSFIPSMETWLSHSPSPGHCCVGPENLRQVTRRRIALLWVVPADCSSLFLLTAPGIGIGKECAFQGVSQRQRSKRGHKWARQAQAEVWSWQEAQKFKIAERLNLFTWVLTSNNGAALNMDTVYGQMQQHRIVLPSAVRPRPWRFHLQRNIWHQMFGEFFSKKKKRINYKISRVPKNG